VLDDFPDDYGMEKIPIYFKPTTAVWIHWWYKAASKTKRFDDVQDFVKHCVREAREEFGKTDPREIDELDRMKREAGIPDLAPFKEEILNLLRKGQNKLTDEVPINADLMKSVEKASEKLGVTKEEFIKEAIQGFIKEAQDG
jgi:hypothetical protein